MPDDQDELVAPAPQAAPPSSPEGDEVVQPAPQQKSFFGKVWDAGIQQKIGETVLFHGAQRAADTAINEWLHGRFSGSGARAGHAFDAATNPGPSAPPTAVHGVLGAIQSGYQQSATGLALRGSLPSVTLDPNGAKWWEKQLAGATQLVSDLPEMIGAGVLATPSGPVGQSAAAFGTPTAIREALITAYSTNQATSVSDFTNRTGLALMHTAQDTELGAIVGGAGQAVKPFAAPVAGAGPAAAFASKALVPATELGTMATAGPILQGRLPEKEDFINGAFMIGGLHLARGVAEGLGNIYAKTGVTPRQVLADAQTDPTIAQDLRVAAETQQAHTGLLEAEAQKATDELKATHEQAFPNEVPSEQNPNAGPGEVPEPAGRTGAGDAGPTWDAATRTWRVGPGMGPEPEPHQGPVENLAPDPKLQDYQTRNAHVVQVGDVPVVAGPRPPYFSFNGRGEPTGSPLYTESPRNVAGAGIYLAQAHADAAAYGGPDAQIHAAYVDASKFTPFDGRVSRTYTPAEATALGVETDGASVTGREILARLNEEHGAGKGLSDFLKSKGFNGVAYDIGMDKHPAWSVFDPRLLKNVADASKWSPEEIARREAFDPTPLRDKVKRLATEVPPTPEIPGAYQSAADAQAVQDAVPGYKSASGLSGAVAQELFLYPATPIPGEPSPTHVNYKYINTPEQVQGALARMSELNEQAIQEQRRGIVPVAQTEAEAGKALATLMGQDGSIQSRAPGTAAGAAELLARHQLMQGAALDMEAQAKALAKLGTNASPEQIADYLTSIDRAGMIQAQFLGARAETSRAFGILQHTKMSADRAEQIQDLISRFRQDPLKLAQMMAQIDSPEGALAFAREATKATTWQKVVEAWKAGLLGPLAVTKKALSDGVMMVSRPLVDAIAYAPSQLSADPAQRMSAVEPLARVIGNVQGASEGLTQAWNEIKLESMGGVTENRAAIPGVTGELIRTPFRLLKAVTVLAKAMQERGEANALAARQASFEGYNPATAEFAEKVAQYSANPSVEASEQIEKFGNRMVFNAPLNPPGKAFQRFINTPVEGNIAPLQLVFPFTKVPLNVFDEQARLSPLAFLSKDWRTDFAQGGAERAKAAAEVVVGMGLTGLGLAWAASGRISGAGDPDPNKRRIAMAAGWQPYSLKLGNTWYSMKNIHPVGTLLGLSADIHEMSQFMTEGESDRAIRTLGQAFAHSVTEQTMLQGMTMVVEALNAPERGVQHLVQSYAASAVPATVAQTASTMDPYMREVNSIRDAIQNRIPGLREDLEPKRDPYGEPIPNPERLGVTLPITKAEESTDKVRTEAARLGIGVAKAPQAINLPTRGLLHGQETKVQMTPEQRDTFASTAGRMAYSIMSPLVHSPDWDQTPDILKAKIYSVAFEKANKIGNAAALSQTQRQQEMQRITDEISSKLHAPAAP